VASNLPNNHGMCYFHSDRVGFAAMVGAGSRMVPAAWVQASTLADAVHLAPWAIRPSCKLEDSICSGSSVFGLSLSPWSVLDGLCEIYLLLCTWVTTQVRCSARSVSKSFSHPIQKQKQLFNDPPKHSYVLDPMSMCAGAHKVRFYSSSRRTRLLHKGSV